MVLPPPPVGSPPNSWAWMEWYRLLEEFVGGTSGLIAWDAVSKTGSNITDIVNRSHQDLQSHQGGASGEYYHLTQEEYTSLNGLSTYVTADSPVTLTANSNGFILANTSGGAITLNLPAASTRKRFTFKKIGGAANNMTINRNGTDTIEGATSLVTSTDYVSWTIESNGIDTWYILAST